MPVVVQGDEQYRRLALALKAAGDKGLRRKLNKAVNKSTRPVAREVRKEARATLPSSGGLNVYVATMSIRTKRYTSAARAGVEITGSKRKGRGKVDVRRINAGTLRHPTYGHNPWTAQHVPPGFWDRPIRKVGPRAVNDIRAAMQVTANEIRAAVIGSGFTL